MTSWFPLQKIKTISYLRFLWMKMNAIERTRSGQSLEHVIDILALAHTVFAARTMHWDSAIKCAEQGHASAYNQATSILQELFDAYQTNEALAAFISPYQSFIEQHKKRKALIGRLESLTQKVVGGSLNPAHISHLVKLFGTNNFGTDRMATLTTEMAPARPYSFSERPVMRRTPASPC
ncbi:hypothetical protein [Brenneria corticis]|uniref:hypothetical protein n=1 Tax=Brenneria corticis TaxID=2173106 RepID=UPI001AEF6F71|nr:hypothetical protein [Brenneria sp. CFCC 11842]